MYYYAYGSNMNEKRMTDRGVNFISKEKGTLEGYKFVVNKKSQKNPHIGFANIIEDKDSKVEGVIYELNHTDIKKLDRFEGYPRHYYRKIININNKECVVYIANMNWTTENELPTSKDYKNHILEGKTYLTNEYYNKLLEIKTV